MIEAQNLTKRYRKKAAVDDISFTVEPGKVTGFLGPNGAGKSTAMRLMLGLDGGGGSTMFDGKPLGDYSRPADVVGVLLEAKSFHPTRKAVNHLRVLATAAQMPESRVHEVLSIVGLTDVANKRPGKFSLGMSQRLGIAAAILTKPKYLLLDEPANGLDPEGIAWLRRFIKDYADQGNAVFVSSHLLSEMSQMADNVIVIGKGKILASTSVSELTTGKTHQRVFVRTTKPESFLRALNSNQFEAKKYKSGIVIPGVTTDEVGKLAAREGLTVLELANQQDSLEEAFLALTNDSQEYRAGGENS